MDHDMDVDYKSIVDQSNQTNPANEGVFSSKSFRPVVMIVGLLACTVGWVALQTPRSSAAQKMVDSEVDRSTLEAAAEFMRQRGFKVVEPSRVTAAFAQPITTKAGENSCDADLHSSCNIQSCDDSLGPSECRKRGANWWNGKQCFCQAGFCNVNGKCVASESTWASEKAYAGCPVATLLKGAASSAAAQFPGMSKELVDKFHAAWVKKGSPKGADKNDHNYDTVLGQGNTLAFVAGSLDVDPAQIPSKYRVGLWAQAASYPVIVRFSDFGSDGGINIARVAVKLQTSGDRSCQFDSSDVTEINLLFTADLPTFPLSDQSDMEAFAYGATPSLWNMFKSVGPAIGQIFSPSGVLQKNYYTQLPFAVGNNAAMRCSLKALNTQSVKENHKAEWIPANQEYFQTQTASFGFQVQFQDDLSSDAVQKQGAEEWKTPTYTVGRLNLPAQPLDDAGMSTNLLQALRIVFPDVDPKTMHKMFLFHPSLTIDEHRAVGETNQFRKFFYIQQATERWNMFLGKPPLAMPFNDLTKAGIFTAP